MKKLLLILILFNSLLFSKEINFNSGEKKVSLIELYSSQGCSSCPPADEWLNSLKSDKNIFKTYIPLAFHVTYWDFLGWKDIFAKKLNDTRQRNYATKIWKNNSIYTPQFIVNAKEYKGWFRGEDFPKLDILYGGNLEVSLKNIKDLKITYFNKNLNNKKLFINIGILGFNQKVTIKSGENENKTLTHDFVILKHYQKFANLINYKLELNTKLYNLPKEKKLALAIWISDMDSNILQASAAYIK